MTTVSQVQVHANPKAAWELIGVLESEVSERDALIASQSAALALAEGALEPLVKYLSIPNSVPDNLWTECKTYPFPMSDESVAAIETELGIGALKSRDNELILWMDGVTVGDFRRAREALAAIAKLKGTGEKG